jgi:hypothetical protein
MLDPDNRVFREYLHAVLEDAGFLGDRTSGTYVPAITFHDLRHTFAAWFLRKGGSLHALRDILGHSDYKTTLRYAHLSPGRLDGQIGSLKTASVLSLPLLGLSGSPDELSGYPESACTFRLPLKESEARNGTSQ